MNYDRFSSWADDEDDDITPDVEPTPEIEPQEPVSSDSPEDIIEIFKSLEVGEKISLDSDIPTFNKVYGILRKQKLGFLPSYKEGKITFRKRKDF